MTETAGPDPGRHETAEERLDRLWDDLVQELRVMQTGTQLIAGFLLTLPFQAFFDQLDSFEVTLYLALVVLASLTTALVLTPVAVHRALSGRHVMARVVAVTHHVVRTVIAAISLLITGMTIFIFDVVLDRTTALVAGALMAAALVLLLVALPIRLVNHGD